MYNIIIMEKPSHLIFLFFFIFIPSVYLYSYHIKFNTPQALVYVPKPSQVYLPEPLEMPFLNKSILGIQAIDPKDIIKFANNERVKVGALPLRISPLLMQAAKIRADIILKYQNFSHLDPYEGIVLATVLPKVNYVFSYAAENIGMGGSSADNFIEGFMHSPPHRDTILNQYYSDSGAAVVTGPYKQYYVNIAVQIFAIPGGKKEKLGYSDDDVKNYKKQLELVDAKLNPFIWDFGIILDKKDYSYEKYVKLNRQREILQNVNKQITEEKPFTNEQVALLMEYNESLN